MANSKFKQRPYPKRLIKRDFSKSVVTTTKWTGVFANVYPDFNLGQCVAMINNDPIARGALNHFVAKCMEGDISYIKKDTLKYDESTERNLNEKFNFRSEVIRDIFMQLRLFNNAYVEQVRTTDKKIKGLNVLDSQNVQPGIKYNGDVLGYSWTVVDPESGEKPTWTDDEIVWVKYNDRAKGWGTIDMQAIWENLLLKDYIRRYITWLWKSGKYGLAYGFSAPKRVVDDFISYLKNTEEDYQAPQLMGGEFDLKQLRDMKENDHVVRLLASLDYQTAVLMRVDPVALGLPDSSGRSNADAKINSFNTDIIDIKKLVQDYINFKLFPRINKNNTLIRFAPNDTFNEKRIWETVQIMDSTGCTNKAKEEYLERNGIYFQAGSIFLPKDAIPKTDGMGNPTNPRNKDNQPSRVGKGEGEANQNQDEIEVKK